MPSFINNPIRPLAIRPVYSPWQESTHTFSGDEIYHNHAFSWWHGIFWKEGRVGQHMKGDAETAASIREDIAKITGRDIDTISHDIRIVARGEGRTHPIGEGDAVIFDTYTVGYSYRELIGEEVFYEGAE